MAITLENVNSTARKQLNWTNDDVVPKVMPDRSPIPANFLGMNLDTGVVYYWNITIMGWKELGGEG